MVLLSPYSVDWSSEPDIPALKYARLLINQDRELAISTLEALVQRGSAMAMVYLGGAYSGSVPESSRDWDRAIYWYGCAFNAGCAYSSYYLGDAYLRAGRIRDAIEILSQGYQKNVPLSIWLLGTLYYQGRFVEKDLREAVRIWSKSAALGHIRSKRHMAHVYIGGYLGFNKIPMGIIMLIISVWSAVRIALQNPKSDLLSG